MNELELDLNIENYELDDILKLFKLNINFDKEDLKKSKKIVLMTHPDKSGLSPNYFRFYLNAYKIIVEIWEYKNKSEKNDNNNELDDTFQFSDSQKKILDNTVKQKNVKEFNKWFNIEFEKMNILKEEDEYGYGNWLKSNEDISQLSQLGKIDDILEMKKKKLRENEVVLNKNMNELYFNGMSASLLTGDAPETYSSELFSNLKYEDLYKAHTETVVPVTMDDFYNVKKFNNVDEYKHHRNNEKVIPLSEMKSLDYLKNKTKMEDGYSTNRAYKLAKQSEKNNVNNTLFWGNLMKLQNY